MEMRAELRRRALRIRRIWLSIGGVLVLGLVVGVVALAGGGSGAELTGVTTATEWDLPALDAETDRIALADFNGKPTVAVFFASWCDVCEHEMPGFVALSDQLGDSVNWVGINSQDRGRGGSDAAKWGIDTRWPLARDIGMGDGRGLATGSFGARGMPLTVIYDESGEVVHVQRGGISATGLLSILGQAFDISA